MSQASSSSLPRVFCKILTYLLLLSGSASAFFPLQNSQANTPLMVGYGSSDAVLTSKTEETYYLGFELGMAISMKTRDVSSYITTDQSWDGSAMGAQKSADRLLKKEILALVGFPTSHEALIASKSSLKANMMGIFTSSLHEDLGKMGPLVISTAPSIRVEVEMFLNFIQKRFPKKKGVFVTNPYMIFDKNQEDVFRELLQEERYKDIQLRTIRLHKELKMALSSDDLVQMAKDKIDYIFIGNYADYSLDLLEQLETTGFDIPLVATASWTSNEFDLIRRMLIRHKAPVYSISHWVQGSKAANIFETGLKQRYGIEPTGASAWGFDLGMIVGTTLARTKKPYSPKAFEEAFYDKPCFEVSSSGELCFKKTGGHATRKMTFVKFSKTGFKPIPELK